ncbi:hypothetical protein TSUD_157370 [Trifolium subterraneum]|uniref:Uncharacterized protein n=1 Tax=Trifolium subterraneum TaxID=3900 RepID=A0A2Z6LY22_TRISU|nr:hypothetical protein TSUD_157370 [Trifolium subterraneum]
MATTPYPKPPSHATLNTIQEITQIYSSLPPRPSIEEIEAATSTLDTLNNLEQTKLQEISTQKPPNDVPDDLFYVLQQLKKTMVLFQSHQQSKEAIHLLELDKMFHTFGDLIQRASELVSPDEDTNIKKMKLPTLVEATEEEEELQKSDDFEDEKGSLLHKPFLFTG